LITLIAELDSKNRIGAICGTELVDGTAEIAFVIYGFDSKEALHL
jgi:hypothetical protein